MHNPEKGQDLENLKDLSLQNSLCTPRTLIICDSNENQHLYFELLGDGESSQKEISKASPYKLTHENYIGHKIMPLHRYKLMKWIQLESQRQRYPRQILALSCCYLDLFLSKAQKTNTSDLQDIALASLMIAIKIQGGFFPKLEKQFDIQKIVMLEAIICLKLNYFLYPTTYLKHMDDYIIAWNTFILKLSPLNQKRHYSEKQIHSSTRIKNLFQKIQYINMISQSLKYDLAQLCFNLFFIETMSNQNILEGHPNMIEDKKFCQKQIKFIYQSYYINKNIFNEFLSFQKNILRFPSLKEEIGIYLLPFVLLKTDNKINMGPYNRLLQTYSTTALKDLDKLAKSIFQVTEK